MKLGGIVLLALTAAITSEVIQSGHKLTKRSADAVQDDIWEDIVPADERWKIDDVFSDVRMSAKSLKKDAERWGVDDTPRRIMAGRHKSEEKEDYSQFNHKGVTSTTSIETLNPVFTKVSDLKQAIEPNHQTFDRLRKQLLKEKNDGSLTFGQAEILLEQTDDAEDLLREIQTLLEPFAPFDHEKATYPPGSLARVEFIEDKMRLCLRERKRIWRAGMSTMRRNRANWGIQTPVSRGSPSRGKRYAETLVDAKADLLQSEDELRESVRELEDESAKAVKLNFILGGVLAGTFLLTGSVIVCMIRCYRKEKAKTIQLRPKSLADVAAGLDDGELEEFLATRVPSNRTRSSRSMPRLPSTQKVSG